MINKIIRKILGKPIKKAITSQDAKTLQPKKISLKVHHIDQKLISPNALKVTQTLQQAGYKAYIVGGAVRDLLLDIKPKDFDVATNATPDQVQALFKKSRVIGKRFQIIHVTFYNNSSHSRDRMEIIEVSTFRALLVETGKHIANSGRVISDNVWGSQSEDATRRDFTINAMYYDPSTQVVLDYHGGMADIEARVLRMIGDPASRYREDPVRMLRAVRFAAKTGFTLEPNTLAPIAQSAPLIHDVPGARLFDEMLKLLMSGHAWSSMTKLREVGLDQGLLPMLDVILEQSDQTSFAKLALDRTDERILQGKSISPGFLFAALLWHQVEQQWKRNSQSSKPSIVALNEAIDEVLSAQREVFAIQRRFEADMREIWSLQPRFEKRLGKMPYRLLESVRFRAGYDFLCLRCQVGELPLSLATWWENFQNGSIEEQEKLLIEAKSENSLPAGDNIGKSRRRRRRGVKGKEALENNDPSQQSF
jgi:poly(A) polymerase